MSSQRVLRAKSAALAGALRELARIPREARRHSPHPPAEGLVIDVGGGQAPHPRAAVVVDKFVADDFERAGSAAIDATKPLVVADGHMLPFADRSFDYAVAAHVLEHTADPARFAAELSRVARAGFVQVPTRESEYVFGWPYHAWVVDRVGDTLVFESKRDLERPLGDAFHDWFAESPLLRLWWGSYRWRWHHSVEWRERLSVTVEATDAAAQKSAVFELEATVEALERLDHAGALKPLEGQARDALRCPVCRGVLRFETARLACLDCGRVFPAPCDVPILLEEVAA